MTIASPGIMLLCSFFKCLLLESWEEEWLPLRVCLPLSSLQDEQYATIWRSLDLFMHQTCAIPYIMKHNICHQWNRESWTIYPPSTSCTKMCPPCTTPMYINHVHQQCAKRYHQWNVSTICQHVHLPICQHVHLPTCQTMCIYQYAKQIPFMSVPSYIITCTKQVYQPCINKLRFPIDIQHDYQSTCLNV